MHLLRTSPLLLRLVVAWFVVVLGVAVASPLVHPVSMQLVCSAGGNVTVVAVDDDGRPLQAGQHTLDCSLCLPTALPLPVAYAMSGATRLPAHEPQFVAVASIAARVGAPLPPRGPPPPTFA